MTQFLESTKQYLKLPKLGRRMSNYNERSASESSLEHQSDCRPVPDRPLSPKKRLSGLFVRGNSGGVTLQGQHPLDSIHHADHADSDSPLPSRHIGYQGLDGREHRDRDMDADGPRASRSWGSTRPKKVDQQSTLQSSSRDKASVHMEEAVPRGRSPTISMSNTFSTATSSYDMRPSDYSSLKQYQAHVWRRNLLEESIMHSLHLGYSERRHRPSSRNHHHHHHGRSPSSRKESLRKRKARDHSMSLALKQGKDLPPFLLSTLEDDIEPVQENIIDRSLKIINDSNRTQPTTSSIRPLPQQQQHLISVLQPAAAAATASTASLAQVRYGPSQSPYPQEFNPSMTNITQSYTSLTLEVEDHHASHIMTLSMIPNLFRIKKPALYSPPGPPRPGFGDSSAAKSSSSNSSRISNSNSYFRPRSRRNSRSSLVGIAPSPRVLTGGKIPVIQPHVLMNKPLPKIKDEDEQDHDEKKKEKESAKRAKERKEIPLLSTPTSASWADSVFESFENVSNGGLSIVDSIRSADPQMSIQVSPANAA